MAGWGVDSAVVALAPKPSLGQPLLSQFDAPREDFVHGFCARVYGEVRPLLSVLDEAYQPDLGAGIAVGAGSGFVVEFAAVLGFLEHEGFNRGDVARREAELIAEKAVHELHLFNG